MSTAQIFNMDANRNDENRITLFSLFESLAYLCAERRSIRDLVRQHLTHWGGDAFVLTKLIDVQRILAQDAVVLDEFRERGGELIVLPEPIKSKVYDIRAIPANDKIVVRAGTHVFPVCHEGSNRSQVMRRVFLDAMDANPKLNIRVYAPHGATGGYDADTFMRDDGGVHAFGIATEAHAIQNWEALSWTAPLTPLTLNDDEANGFKSAFGAPKVQRALTGYTGITDESLALGLQPPQQKGRWTKDDIRSYVQKLKAANDAFSMYYWNMKPMRKAPVLFIAFHRATMVCMRRLLESNEGSLGNVRIVAMRWMDPVNATHDPECKQFETDGREAVLDCLYTAAYTQYAQLFTFEK